MGRRDLVVDGDRRSLRPALAEAERGDVGARVGACRPVAEEQQSRHDVRPRLAHGDERAVDEQPVARVRRTFQHVVVVAATVDMRDGDLALPHDDDRRRDAEAEAGRLECDDGREPGVVLRIALVAGHARAHAEPERKLGIDVASAVDDAAVTTERHAQCVHMQRHPVCPECLGLGDRVVLDERLPALARRQAVEAQLDVASGRRRLEWADGDGDRPRVRVVLAVADRVLERRVAREAEIRLVGDLAGVELDHAVRVGSGVYIGERELVALGVGVVEQQVVDPQRQLRVLEGDGSVVLGDRRAVVGVLEAVARHDHAGVAGAGPVADKQPESRYVRAHRLRYGGPSIDGHGVPEARQYLELVVVEPRPVEREDERAEDVAHTVRRDADRRGVAARLDACAEPVAMALSGDDAGAHADSKRTAEIEIVAPVQDVPCAALSDTEGVLVKREPVRGEDALLTGFMVDAGEGPPLRRGRVPKAEAVVTVCGGGGNAEYRDAHGRVAVRPCPSSAV